MTLFVMKKWAPIAVMRVHDPIFWECIIRFYRIASMENFKYPVGIQSFEQIRCEDYVYVDKTDVIYRLVTTGNY